MNELQRVFSSDFENNVDQGVRCPNNYRKSRSNKLAPACMYPGEGACRTAYTRANASFADARGQKAWRREGAFDRIEIIAEMDEQRFRAGLDSEPFYTKLYNPRWPHTSEEHRLEMDVDAER